MPTTKTVTLRLDPELLAQIDKARGLVPREAWLRQAAEEKLAQSDDEGDFSDVLADGSIY